MRRSARATTGRSPARLGQGDGWGQGPAGTWTADAETPPTARRAPAKAATRNSKHTTTSRSKPAEVEEVESNGEEAEPSNDEDGIDEVDDVPETNGHTEEPAATVDGTNWVDGGLGHGTLTVPLLLLVCPLLCQLLAYACSDLPATPPHAAGVLPLLAECAADPDHCWAETWAAATIWPTAEACRFLLVFAATALILDLIIPGPIKEGIETQTGHMPKYVENGVGHCVLFTAAFVGGSNFGLDLYDFGVFYDVFPASVSVLNGFGLVLAAFLQFKGLYFPSTADSGTTGSFLADFAWGTELYPQVFGIDIKRFVNCRFSMTFWQLAGLSFAYKSYTIHGEIDWGLTLSAVSQYLYLFKFFMWEIGYLRSIDIIVDRAGWEIQWGCLVFVPSVYTLCTRVLVRSPSQLSFPAAAAIFGVGMAGVVLNYLADEQRQLFRASGGKLKIFGREPVYVVAHYTVVDNGKPHPRTSLLLASGFWGAARHFQYLFELMAAYSWCLLANPFVNGALPMLYCTFLTILLLDRAKRDERKCLKKYGKDYEDYMRLVPYKVLPGVY